MGDTRHGLRTPRQRRSRTLRAVPIGVVALVAMLLSPALTSAAGAAVPSRPQGVSAALSGPDGLSVSFTRPASNGGKAITGYRATCSSDTGGVTRTASRASSPIRVGTLTRGSRYTCVVRAVNADGVGAASLPSAPVTIPGPPSRPLAVTARQGARLNARIAFDPPASDGTSPITRYVARCVSGTTLFGASGVASPLYTKGPMPTGLTFRCQVRAVNSYGYGPWSASSAPFTIKAAAPPTMVVAAGGAHSCALYGGTVKCWGSNWSGQLGIGDEDARGDEAGEMGDQLVPVELGTGRTATTVAAGYYYTCALLDDASLKCWGNNEFGKLGIGDSDNRGDAAGEMGDALPPVDLGTGRTAKALAPGLDHLCALLDDGTVKCWGSNFFGELGQGDTEARGDAPGEMGDALQPVDLGTGRTAKAITAGSYHNCALLDDGTVKCWGYGNSGQLGLGTSGDVGDAAGEMGDALPPVDLGTGRTAKAIAAGYDHTCALLDDGTVKCWGRNSYGQLGLGDTFDRGYDADQMGDDLLRVDLGTGRTATAIATGYRHTCALLDDGTVKCWGRNSFGQLGLGDPTDRGDEPDEMGDDLPPVDLGTGRSVKLLAVGSDHVCVVLDDTTVKCWGDNGDGQLGRGDTAARGDGPDEMGDDLPPVELGTGWP